MREEDRNQTLANTVVDYRVIVQRDILLPGDCSAEITSEL